MSIILMIAIHVDKIKTCIAFQSIGGGGGGGGGEELSGYNV